MREYFRNIHQSVKTILIGLGITLKYCFARTITVQYPDVGPTLKPRFRGIHYFEIEKCIACDLCAKACPVDCIYIEKTAPRKIDKESGVARGGAMQRYAIDYSKCMFCSLCVEPCPTDCIHMGDVHDLSLFDRGSMVVEFTELAKQGLRTPVPAWMQREETPAWAVQSRKQWIDRGLPYREEMLKALEEHKVEKKPAAEKPAPEKAAAATPATGDKPAPTKPAVTEKPAAANVAVEKPAASENAATAESAVAVEKPPVAAKPTAEKAAPAANPSAEKPATEKPGPDGSVAAKPVVGKAADEKPAGA